MKCSINYSSLLRTQQSSCSRDGTECGLSPVPMDTTKGSSETVTGHRESPHQDQTECTNSIHTCMPLVYVFLYCFSTTGSPRCHTKGLGGLVLIQEEHFVSLGVLHQQPNWATQGHKRSHEVAWHHMASCGISKLPAASCGLFSSW